MTDNQILAPEASDEVVPTEVAQTEAPEAVESTEGQEAIQPAVDDTPEEAQAKADAEAADQKSKSAERRERRKAREAALRESEAEAVKAAQDAEAKLAAVREATQALPKPRQSDYPDFEEFQAALSAYNVAQIIDGREMQQLESRAKQHFDQVDAIKAEKQQEDAQNWAAQVQEGRAKYADFDTVAMSEQVTVTPEMAALIVQSDVAADVSYYIGKNPHLGAEIAKLDSVNMARAIGRLEAQVTAPKPKTATDAPQPITPVKGKATAAKSADKMSYEEYRAARMAGKL